MTRERSTHLVFMGLFGLLGWTALLSATYVPGFAPPFLQSGTEALPFCLFFLVIVAARGMAFRMLPETLVSLDSAFYMAAVVCLGSVTAGRLVALALTLDALLRLLGADAAGKRPRGALVEDLAFVVYFGGMTGGLLMGVGWLFGVDQRALALRPGAQLAVTSVVFSVGCVFLLMHYLLQGARLVLAGHQPRAYLSRMALPGILAEASLLPLAVVVILIYRPEQPLGFVLLGATYLLINFVFNRLSHTSAALRQRVGELETLNRTAHALGSTLQLHELVEALSRETLSALPEAEILALSHPEGGEQVVDCFDRARGAFERVRAPKGGGAAAWIAAHRQALCIPDLKRADTQLGLDVRDDAGIRSFLGVPIVIYDEVVGVLSVQSREKGAFGEDQLRLLEAIGAQAAVAIQNARLYELATVDGLTGLYVRRYFDSRLKEELERSKRFGAPFSLILMDLDDFKALNDTHGHPLGDRVLRETAQAVRRCMRGVDIAARYGGEEFAFILPRTAIVDAHAVAERIRNDIAELRIVHDGKTLAISASLGVACYPESGAGSADDVVRRADTALYRAKATGKNRVELFWSTENEPSTVRHLRPVK